MRIKQPISFVIGILILLFALYMLIFLGKWAGLFPLFISVSLIFASFYKGRKVTIILGHMLIVIGCILVAWGVYLLPYTGASLIYVFVRPLFWGFDLDLRRRLHDLSWILCMCETQIGEKFGVKQMRCQK